MRGGYRHGRTSDATTSVTSRYRGRIDRLEQLVDEASPLGLGGPAPEHAEHVEVARRLEAAGRRGAVEVRAGEVGGERPAEKLDDGLHLLVHGVMIAEETSPGRRLH
jgi:hypothetical protein